LHVTKEEFHQQPKERPNFLEYLEKDASLLRNNSKWNDKPILLSFIGDCYQPIELETKLTRAAIEILHEYGLKVMILTKGGKRAMRDFDLLGPGDSFATTLTCLRAEDSIQWEPGAALPWDRILSLKVAHRLGLDTWVSLEPVIYPGNSMRLMEMTKDFVGHYKVGTMNYHPHGKEIDWHDFGWKIKRRMDELGVKYYLKKDLRREMRLDEGGDASAKG